MIKEDKTKNRLRLVVVTILTLIIGTMWHFFYDWSGGNHLLGYVAPVDESILEHMKLIFYPLLLVGIYQAVYFKDIRRMGSMIFSGIFGIPLQMIIFYTYWSILGHSVVAIDIATYYLVMITILCIGFKLSDNKLVLKLFPLSLALALGMICLFSSFSYNKPNVLPKLFKELETPRL